MTYVIDRDEVPLMPTKRGNHIRHMLKRGEARVVRLEPFTVQILRDVGHRVQAVVLGVDVGSKHIGLSATTKNEELYSAQAEVRDDVTGLLTARREFRRARRGRKHNWYRPPRFDNRRKYAYWLPPSVRCKAEAHLRMIRFVLKMLPVRGVRLEIGKFDSQKIQNPSISGEQYQNGTLAGWENLKAYAKWRDGYKCRVCGKSHRADPIVHLEVHHIRRRADGGSDTPENVVTLCHECHEKHHKKDVVLKFRRPPVHKNEAHMNAMRNWLEWKVIEMLPSDIEPNVVFGYETEIARREHGIAKSHMNDAFCISSGGVFNHFGARRSTVQYHHKFVRRHNRCLHKSTILKGGYRKSNQAPKYVFGYRLFDKVKYKGQNCFIFGRRSSGSFDIRKLDGTKISDGVSYKRLKPLTKSGTMLTERIVCNSSQA